MKAKSLKKLFFASFTGRLIFAVTSLIALPFLAKIFGAEGIGLIGFFNTVVMVVMILEGGLTSNLINKLAKLEKRYSYAPKRYFSHSYGMINSYIICFALIGGVVAVSVNALADLVANNWLVAEDLSVAVVANSIRWIGAFVGINFIVVVAQGALVGREQQVEMSMLYSLYSIARTVGVVAFIYLFAKEINVAGYFAAQVLCQCLYLGALIYFVYRKEWSVVIESRFGFRYIVSGGAYSVNIFVLSITSVLVVQSDKLYLSGAVALGDYAAYSLAATVAALPYICSSALYSVIFPRFSIDVAKNNVLKLEQVFTSAICGVVILMIILCSVVWMFSEITMRVLFDQDLASGAAKILPILMLGTAIQSVLIIPFALQLANRWTSLVLRLNLYLAPVYLVCLWGLVSYLGVVGAAYAWLTYNVLSLVGTVYFMVKRYRYLSKSFKVGLKVVSFMSIISILPIYFTSHYAKGGGGDYQALGLMVLVSIILLLLGVLRFKRELSGFF
ncbi:lipopolysaccharide biosynthesis protein [Halopseudomonas pelagia]|uniref:Polysaccharide biosynthesis protein n=1 Tax=Halopseudomonas pelagia TaxID=553151 RepID=A0AA91Z5B3_9GAMM|nr:oligosaccharide flippase family protein [Halopseudomonas pelagia]PCC98415.1 hypothetical protein CO192_15715 [Halopseudomonas pelagia]QFY57687.1 hypothetical protein EAO82_15730 [Halopseudomonas pelagia]